MALTKGTATDYLDLVDELDAFITADWVDTIAINAGGTGYTVGDILTVAGGTVTHHAAQIIVTSVSSGVIDGARLHDSGGYSADPSLSANAVTGGTGSGATFDLTMESDPWTIELSSTIESTEEVRIYQGSGGGGTFVGFRTYQEDTGAREARNWALFGLTSYNGGLPWYQQPDTHAAGSEWGFSNTDGTMDTNGAGSIAVFKDNDGTPMDYWIHVTNRRIIVIAKLYDGVTTTPRYSSLYMGLLNPFGTSDEYPYPLYIAGCTGYTKCAWDDLVPAFHFNGITVLHGNGFIGPGAYYGVDGLWKNVQNGRVTFGASTSTGAQSYCISPIGQPLISARPTGEDIAVDSSASFQWEQMVAVDGGSYSTPTEYTLVPTPDSGGEKRLLVPCVLTMSVSANQDYDIVGEMDGVKYVSVAGTVQATAEDELDDADTGDFYRIYPNGVMNGILWGYFCVRED